MNKRQRAKRAFLEGMKKSEEVPSCSDAKVQIEMHEDPEIRTYNVTTEISRHPIHSFDRPLRESSEKYLKDIGGTGAKLIREMIVVPGVVKITIHPYEVSVVKGKAFSWNAIEPKVLGILERVSM